MFYLIYFLLKSISLIPLKGLYFLSDLFYLIVFYSIRYRKSVVTKNLQNSFPDKSPEELQNIIKDFYRHLVDFMFESIKIISFSIEDASKGLRIKNIELIQHYYDKKQSIIVVSGHYGNWEWFNLLSQKCDFECYVTYKPLSSKSMNQLFMKSRTKFGMKVVTMKDTPRTIIKNKNNVCLYGLIADQRPMRSESNHWTKFLNQDALVFMGAEKLAKTTGYPVIYVDFQKVKRGSYEAEFSIISDTPKATSEGEITNLFFSKLEETIRKKPEFYLWSHNRWKYKKQ